MVRNFINVMTFNEKLFQFGKCFTQITYKLGEIIKKKIIESSFQIKINQYNMIIIVRDKPNRELKIQFFIIYYTYTENPIQMNLNEISYIIEEMKKNQRFFFFLFLKEKQNLF